MTRRVLIAVFQQDSDLLRARCGRTRGGLEN